MPNPYYAFLFICFVNCLASLGMSVYLIQRVAMLDYWTPIFIVCAIITRVYYYIGTQSIKGFYVYGHMDVHSKFVFLLSLTNIFNVCLVYVCLYIK